MVFPMRVLGIKMNYKSKKGQPLTWVTVAQPEDRLKQ